MVMDFENPTIGGGTAYQDMLAQLLGQLGDERGGRAGAGLSLMDMLLQARGQGAGIGTDLLDRLIGRREFGVGTNMGLLDRLQARQGNIAGTNLSLLSLLGGQRQAGAGQVGGLLQDQMTSRLGGGQLGLGLLGEMGQQGIQRGGLGIDLLGTLGQQQLGRGGLAADVLGQLSSAGIGRGALGADLLSRLAQERQGRAGTAQALFNPLLQAEMEARRRPVSLVDQLALAGQYGSMMPLSQVGSEQLSAYGLKPGALTGDLHERILALTEAAPEQGELIERIMAAMETPEEQEALMEAIYGALGPLEGQEGIVADIRAAMQQPEGAAGLIDAITEAMQGTPEEAAMLEDALSRLDPSATEEEIMETIRGAFDVTAGEQQLVKDIREGTQPGEQEEGLIEDIGEFMEPGDQFGDLAELIGTYAGGAIPQAVVIETFPARGGGTAGGQVVVRLANGTFEMVPIEGSGVVTVQGSRGPFTVNMDEAADEYQRASQDFGGFGSISQWAMRASEAEQLMAQFRTAGPGELQDLINFFGARPEEQDALAEVAPETWPPEVESGWQTPPAGADAPPWGGTWGEWDPDEEPVEDILGFAEGGSVLVDPLLAKTQGKTIAGPATLVDRNQQAVGVMGEAGLPESVDIRPRDVRFRYEDVAGRNPGMGAQDLLARAERPGEFETEQNPTAIASRLLGNAIQSDVRFQDPFVRALSLGQRPAPSDVTARDFSMLPPDLQASLASIIGQDLFPSWMFELGMQTPQAMQVRPRVVGGVRV